MRIVCEEFNIVQIAESGQVFRMNQIKPNHYSLIAFGKYLEVYQVDDTTVELSCEEEEYDKLWRDYFDLDYNYERIIKQLTEGEDEFLKQAGSYGKGIRILQQEPFEMLISFIISQNKNIPSIKACIERICESYGDKNTHSLIGITYYSFPTPQRLAKASKEELREMKLGYRDDYIIAAASAVAEGRLLLEELKERSHEEAVTALKQIKGIGDKVANCVSLYGLHHIEAFPVDVWISRVLTTYYQKGFSLELYPGYGGIIQQYMFYYIRALAEVK